MEYILGSISKLIDPAITNIKNHDYAAWSCVAYQRATVLIGDFLLFFALSKLCRALSLSKKTFTLLLASIQAFTGLVLVDNMHFQYNTILFSVFFLSIAYIANEQFIIGALFYTVALCMKHIFVYTAPGFLAFYLKYYILQNKKLSLTSISNLIKVGSCIVFTIFISFSPFIMIALREKGLEPIIQIFRRLFQFKRGLLHSYWAANAWAIYSFTDKVMLLLKGNSIGSKKNTSAGGVTKETGFDVLPDITPMISNGIVIGCTLIFILKCLIFDKRVDSKYGDTEKVFVRKQKAKSLIRYCIVANLIFYNFGWQVHEKAFIIVSLLTIMYYVINQSQEEYNEKGTGRSDIPNDILITLSSLIVTVGSLTQMPLIHDYRDYLPKIMLFITYTLFVTFFLFNKKRPNLIISFYVIICLLLDFNEVFKKQFTRIEMIHKINERYPFLSLMLFSVINSMCTQIIFILLFI